MKNKSENSDILQASLIQRENQEYLVSANQTSEVLTKLNISLENLPQKCQQLLRDAATAKISTEVNELDPVSISLVQSREKAEELDDEYELLKLRHKNEELQTKIDRNNCFLEQLRKELQSSRDSMSKKDPSPDHIQEYCRQMKLKVACYEENLKKSKSNQLSIPEHVLPKSLQSLATSLAELRQQAHKLRRSADDIALAKQARQTLLTLRR